MAAFTIEEYFAGFYPNLATLLPGFSPASAINGAMALYWSYMFGRGSTGMPLWIQRWSFPSNCAGLSPGSGTFVSFVGGILTLAGTDGNATFVVNNQTRFRGFSSLDTIPVGELLYVGSALVEDVATANFVQLPSHDVTNPNDPAYLDEGILTERRKWMISLRVAVGLAPTINSWISSPQILEAQAGPAMAKFQDLSKLLRVVLPLWQTDLTNCEAAEGIFFNLLPNTPAYLLAMAKNYPLIGDTIPWVANPVIQSGSFFVEGEYFPALRGEGRAIQGGEGEFD